MTYLPVTSSQITAVAYDPETKTLGIKFKPTSSQPDGSEYHYSGVEPEAWTQLQAADSVGSHFHKNIKGRYGFNRIN